MNSKAEESNMISVAMTTYNGELYISQQLASIFKQTLQPQEVIICDDGSTDKTVEIIEEFIRSRQLETKWMLIRNSERMGYIKNFLHAITLTSGEYIFLSDQDDYFLPTKFETVIKKFRETPEALIINCSYSYMDGKGNELRTATLRKPRRKKGVQPLDFRTMLYNSNYPGFSMALRKKLVSTIEAQDIAECYGHDLLLNLMAISMEGCYEIPDVLSVYRIHNNNTSGQWENKQSNDYDRRIAQKEKELVEYESLKKLCRTNHFHHIDESFIEYRERILNKRISCLKKKKILPLLFLLLTERAYPMHTVLGDVLFVLRRKKDNMSRRKGK